MLRPGVGLTSHGVSGDRRAFIRRYLEQVSFQTGFVWTLEAKRTGWAEKGKAVPLQDWTGPEGSKKLRFPDYVTAAQGGGKVVSLTHRPLFTPRKYSRYSFLLEAESTPGP